jgi:hypothetical protein
MSEGVKAKSLFKVHEVGGAWILSTPDTAVSESFPTDEKSGGDKRLVYALLKRLGIHRRLNIVPFKEG